ncbi:MAG: hypothetical protein QXD62_00675 [Candidatus Woesearchaeota archaeon]
MKNTIDNKVKKTSFREAIFRKILLPCAALGALIGVNACGKPPEPQPIEVPEKYFLSGKEYVDVHRYDGNKNGKGDLIEEMEKQGIKFIKDTHAGYYLGTIDEVLKAIEDNGWYTGEDGKRLQIMSSKWHTGDYGLRFDFYVPSLDATYSSFMQPVDDNHKPVATEWYHRALWEAYLKSQGK